MNKGRQMRKRTLLYWLGLVLAALVSGAACAANAMMLVAVRFEMTPRRPQSINSNNGMKSMALTLSTIRATSRLTGLVLACGLGIAILTGCGGTGGGDSGERYFASWTAAMADTDSGLPGVPLMQPTVLTDQTVRHIVRLSLPAQTIRIKVSNLFGTEPLTFSGVRVAKSTGLSSIDTSTDTGVTFNGQSTVTVGAGAEMYSDDVSLAAMPDRTSLAVTFYFADRAVLRTVHGTGMQLAYIGSGNQLSAASLPTAVGSSTHSPYFGLTAVESLRAQSTRVVVAFGDSITDGYMSSMDANKRYPNLLDDRLKGAGQADTSVVNSGISGNRWLYDGVGPNGNTRFDRDVLKIAGVSHVIIMLGINDIGLSLGTGQDVSVDQLTAAIAAAVAKSQAAGVKVVLGTLMPYKGAAYYTSEGEAKRQQVNAWIRSNTAIDGRVDFDAAMRSSADLDALNPSFDSGDHLHPNDVGYAAMANAVDLNLLH